jgi:hypothetical protein
MRRTVDILRLGQELGRGERPPDFGAPGPDRVEGSGTASVMVGHQHGIAGDSCTSRGWRGEGLGRCLDTMTMLWQSCPRWSGAGHQHGSSLTFLLI